MTLSGGGWVTVPVATEVHPLPSVRVTVYDPAPNPVMVGPVAPVLHSKLNGGTPLAAVAVTAPLSAPGQLTGVTFTATFTGMKSRVMQSTVPHWLASVRVMQ